EDVADGAPVRLSEDSGPIVLPDLLADREAAGKALQAGDAAQRRGLAAAGGAEEPGDAAHWRGERHVEREAAEPAGEGRLDRRCVPIAGRRAHRPGRPIRFSKIIMASTTAKEKTSMPPARMFTSRQRRVST